MRYRSKPTSVGFLGPTTVPNGVHDTTPWMVVTSTGIFELGTCLTLCPPQRHAPLVSPSLRTRRAGRRPLLPSWLSILLQLPSLSWGGFNPYYGRAHRLSLQRIPKRKNAGQRAAQRGREAQSIRCKSPMSNNGWSLWRGSHRGKDVSTKHVKHTAMRLCGTAPPIATAGEYMIRTWRFTRADVLLRQKLTVLVNTKHRHVMQLHKYRSVR